MSRPTHRNKATEEFALMLANLCRPNTTAVSEPADKFERVYVTNDDGVNLRITIEDESQS